MEEPLLLPGDQFYLSAFHELSTTRAIGFSIGPIPWDKIVSYAASVGLDDDLQEDFHQLIRVLDNSYLKWSADKAK